MPRLFSLRVWTRYLTTKPSQWRSKPKTSKTSSSSSYKPKHASTHHSTSSTSTSSSWDSHSSQPTRSRPTISSPIQIPSLTTTVSGPTPNILLPPPMEPEYLPLPPSTLDDSSNFLLNPYHHYEYPSPHHPSTRPTLSTTRSDSEGSLLSVNDIGSGSGAGGRGEPGGSIESSSPRGSMVRRRSTVKQIRRRSGVALSTYSTHSMFYAPISR